MSLRILHVTPYFREAWAYGGIPRLATTLTTALARLGHRVTVCTTDAGDRDRCVPSRHGPVDALEVHVFPNRSNRLAYELQLFTPQGLGRFLAGRTGQFDIAHIHGHRHLLEVTGARWCRASGVPYVSAPNGTAPRIEQRTALKQVWDAVWGRADLAGAAAVLAVSEAERRQLMAHGVAAGRIRVVPNPLDLDEFDPPPETGAWRARLGIEGPMVVFLGRLSPRKRLDVVIAAVASLPRHDVRLVIAGNDMGAGRDAEVRAGRAGLGARTAFTGLLSGRSRLELLADADVVVYPSADEVFGLVPLEALLCGAPVVVADDSGCGEIVRDLPGGQVVALGDAAALGQAIEHVLSAPASWRTAAAKGGQLVRSRYGGPMIAERIDALYRQLLAR